jgi:hypothetical protein
VRDGLVSDVPLTDEIYALEDDKLSPEQIESMSSEVSLSLVQASSRC